MVEKQPTRSKPTRDLIQAISGGNKTLLSWVHHGLDEIPLAKIYPFLNLNELIIFAGISWRARDSDKEKELYRKLTSEKLPDYFDAILSVSRNKFYQKCGFCLDDVPGRIPDNLKDRYKAVNPFHVDVKERLRHVSESVAETLKEALQRQTLIHVFEDQYFAIKRNIRNAFNLGRDIEIDPQRLKLMNFQNCRARDRTEEKVVSAYVNEVNRMIGRYPRGTYDSKEFPKVQGILFDYQ